MHSTAHTSTDHVFLPLILRAQLATAGAVIGASMLVAGLGAVDLSSLRALLGA